MRQVYRRYPAVFGVLWVSFLLLIAFSFAMFQGGFVSWFIFYSFLPIMLYTITIAIYPLNDISVERVIEKEALYAGETLKVSVTLTRKIPFPIFYLVIEDRLPQNLLFKHQKFNPDYSLKPKGLFSLGFNRKEVFRYEIPNIPRGEFRLNGISLKTGDLFGFIQKKLIIPIEQKLVVYPQLQNIASWRPPAHNEGGHHRSKKSFEYDLTSVSSVRDYIPGDRLSWLDWKATARSNKLVTKQFEYPLNRDVVIILDRTHHKEGYIKDIAYERAVSLSASLVRQGLISGSSVGFLSIGEEHRHFPMESSHTQQWQILTHLAHAEADGNVDVALVLKKLINSYSQHPAIAYVTTNISDRLQSTFHELMYRGLTIELFLVTNDSPLDEQLKKKLSHLEIIGVKVYRIRHSNFNDMIKVGVQRATS